MTETTSDIVVSTKNGEIHQAGRKYKLHVGDLVRAGHPITVSHPDWFKPADTKLKYDVVDRSNPPTSERDATVTPIGARDVTRSGPKPKRAA